jgi:hypothetical protein
MRADGTCRSYTARTGGRADCIRLKARLRPLFERDSSVSRDQLLYVADMVSAGEAVLRYTDGVPFEVFVASDEERAAVELAVDVHLLAALSAVLLRLGHCSDLWRPAHGSGLQPVPAPTSRPACNRVLPSMSHPAIVPLG